MRYYLGCALSAAATLIAIGVPRIAAHPGCFDDGTLLQDVPLVFCPVEDDGACCTVEEEQSAINMYNSKLKVDPSTLGDDHECLTKWKEVACGPCGSYSLHLFSRLGTELGLADGMTLKKEFCTELVNDCYEVIDFPDYPDGESYCEKHTEEEDEIWSHPIDEDEKTASTSTGLVEAFPSLNDGEGGDFPEELISMKMTPDGTKWWLIGQMGQIREVAAVDPETSEEVLDISEGRDLRYEYEEGLLDMAFDPEFHDNDFFYCSYTIDNNGYKNRLARFTYNSGDPAATDATYIEVLTSRAKSSAIHSAGWVDFKPATRDLYWAIGDGGKQQDPDGRGSDLSNILASIVRVGIPLPDLDDPSSDDDDFDLTPGGNMKLGSTTTSICASGFRNPFRCGFDKKYPHELYCGDVGHEKVEEISLVECGNDYGWSRFEGSRCQEEQEERFEDDFDADCPNLPRDGITFPIYEYCHGEYPDDPMESAHLTGGKDVCGDRYLEGQAVIGGYPYRGQRFEEVLEGAVLFADFQQRGIYYIKKNEADDWIPGTIIGDRSARIISFAEDNDGEQYVIGADRKAYQLPCGDLCPPPEEPEDEEESTCLEQIDRDDQPAYQSEGCWGDSTTNRALLHSAPRCSKNNRRMSPEICARYCAEAEPTATYFGVEYSYECFCGDDSSDETGYRKHGELDDDECRYFCTDGSGDYCGGFEAIEVFSFENGGADSQDSDSEDPGDGPTPTPPASGAFTEVGCFVDTAKARVLTIEAEGKRNSVMTAEYCAGLCAGSTYFGVEYSYECFCSFDGGDGNDADVPGRLGTSAGCSDPTYACPGGDGSEICGGFEAIQVYRLTEDSVEDSDGSEDPEDSGEGPSPTPPTSGDFAEVGCFVDTAKDRVLSIDAEVDDNDYMTAEYCAGLCVGSTYFGVEFSYECFCSFDGGDGNDADVPGRLGTSAGCSNPRYDCPGGDGSEICGGFNAIQVYRLTEDSVEDSDGSEDPDSDSEESQEGTGICSSLGIAGIDNGDGTVCCHPECPQCGGKGCKKSARSVGLDGTDCCVSGVLDDPARVFCSDRDVVAGPCIV